MKLVGISIDDVERIPTYIERWYDRKSRSWIVQLLDQNKHELEAYYEGDKQNSLDIVKDLKKKHSIK